MTHELSDSNMEWRSSGRGRVVRVDQSTTKSGKTLTVLVVQVDGTYPQTLGFKCFGPVAQAAANCAPESMVSITCRLGGREWNGKVFCDLVAESVAVIASAAPAGPSSAAASDDDVPF